MEYKPVWYVATLVQPILNANPSAMKAGTNVYFVPSVNEESIIVYDGDQKTANIRRDDMKAYLGAEPDARDAWPKAPNPGLIDHRYMDASFANQTKGRRTRR